MKAKISITIGSPQELVALMAAIAGVNIPCAPAAEVAPTEQDGVAVVQNEDEPEETTETAAQSEEATETAAQPEAERESLVTTDDGRRLPLGEALKALEDMKSKGGVKPKPIIGHHDDGDIRYWNSTKEFCQEMGVPYATAVKARQEYRKVKGWLLEYDEERQ